MYVKSSILPGQLLGDWVVVSANDIGIEFVIVSISGSSVTCVFCLLNGNKCGTG